MTQEKIQEKLSEANNKVSDVKRIQNREIQAEIIEKVAPLIQEAKSIEAEINKRIYAKYEDEIKVLQHNANEIEKELNSLKVMDSSKMWYAPGTVVERWKNIGRSNGVNWVRTGQKGIVEIYEQGSPMPDNIGRYSYPEIGNIIVRLLKKDGSPGLKFERISSKWNNELTYEKDYWAPEGIDKNISVTEQN